jgi:elongation factor P--(R)-beta-lysine ligase
MKRIRRAKSGYAMTEAQILRARHDLLRAIREFFYDRDYLEVGTPSLLRTSPPDPHIDPLKVYVGEKGPFYLHTSPEVHMKRLLPHGQDRIFQICNVFRVEELEEIHSAEFTMLEWYREGTYEEAMDEVQELTAWVAGRLKPEGIGRFEPPFAVYELDRLFLDKTGIDPLTLNREALFSAMEERGFAGIDEKDGWEELFFKLLIQEVEGAVAEEAPYFIKDWPRLISTMAKGKTNHKVERFEFYVDGVEIANGYTELLDAEEQRARFARDNEERVRLGKETFHTDESFLEALARLKGPYAGVALGVDRLLMKVLGLCRIDEVTVNRFRACP